MNSKITLFVALLAVSLSSLEAKDIRKARAVSDANNSRWYEKGVRFAYDCSGKEDGNYPHPTKCTHYVACVAGTNAYEMECALSTDGKLLHYVATSGPNPQESKCDYPEIAGCEGPAPVPETTEGSLPQEPETTQGPVDDLECNPDECQLEGNCQSYRQCVRNEDTGKGRWEPRNCAEDLFWNPDANSVHGGVCDYFGNLTPAVQQKYEEDETCIPPCAWFQEAGDSCSPNYTYRRQFDGKKNSGRESRLSCPSGASADDQGLIWNQATLTCDRCSNVNDANGSPCPCQ